MKILFLSIGNLKNLLEHALYPDLLRSIKEQGHDVYAICANEKRNGEETKLSVEANINVLRVRTGNITKVNLIEKGISTLLIESQFKRAIKKHFKNIKFDLVIYSTPPITFVGAISYIKKRDNAKTYLLLKDIFPQNAVDIGMMTKSGPKSIIYKTFKKKEEALYKISDYIGCMSQANVDFILKNNPEINADKVHICPNAVEVLPFEKDMEKRKEIRQKWGIPEDKTVFVYGGNLGRPQGIPFLIECLKANADKEDRFFVVCGKGTEYGKLKAYYDTEKPKNLLLLNGLPKEEYEEFVKAFDVGLIFLDHRFTIPNFPSRLLSYMQSKMPVITCTDPNTDIGKVAEEGGFGIASESSDPENFTKAVDKMLTCDLEAMGEAGYTYLTKNYTSRNCYDIIMEKIGESKKEKVLINI